MATKKQQKIESNVPEMLREMAEIQARIQADEDRYNELYEQLSQLEPGTYEGYGADSVRISSYTRLNAERALSMLSPRSQAKVMVLRPDARLIRKHFPGVAKRATDKFDNRVAPKLAVRHLVAVD